MKVMLTALAGAVLLASTPAMAQDSDLSSDGARTQGHSTQWRTQSADVDSHRYSNSDSARELVRLARCVVSFRTAKARAVVNYADGKAQKEAVKGLLKRDEEHCLNGYFATRMKLPEPLLITAVAGALVLKDYPDLPAVIARQPTTAAPVLDGNEAFGRCVVQRDPAGVLVLLQADWTSPAEQVAIKELLDDLGPCLANGRRAEITPVYLRQVTAIAGYRLAQHLQPRAEAGN